MVSGFMVNGNEPKRCPSPDKAWGLAHRLTLSTLNSPNSQKLKSILLRPAKANIFAIKPILRGAGVAPADHRLPFA